MIRNVTYSRNLRNPVEIGHFTFNGIKVPFYDCYGNYTGKCYLIDSDYQSTIEDLSKSIGDIQEDIYKDNSDATYHNSYINEVFLTTNFEGKMEVRFITNIPTHIMREIKLKLIINE